MHKLHRAIPSSKLLRKYYVHLGGGDSWKAAETPKSGIFVVEGLNKCHQMGRLIQSYNATLYWKDLLLASCWVIQKVCHRSAGISEIATLWEGNVIGLKCDFTRMCLLIHAGPCFLVMSPLITWSSLGYCSVPSDLFTPSRPHFVPLFSSLCTAFLCQSYYFLCAR